MGGVVESTPTEDFENFFTIWGIAEFQRHFGVDGVLALLTFYGLLSASVYFVGSDALQQPMFLDGVALRKAAIKWEKNNKAWELNKWEKLREEQILEDRENRDADEDQENETNMDGPADEDISAIEMTEVKKGDAYTELA